MHARLALVAAAAMLSAACLIVREEDEGKTTEVNIATPVGALAARTGEGAGDTGLPLYPGAQLSTDGGDDDRDQANVTVGTPWFGLHVRAAEYESADAPERVLGFYRERMKEFGAVIECRGDVDFNGGRPVCHPEPGTSEVNLLTGTEDLHRIVSIKPRRGGSEFALVSIQIGS